MTAPSPAYDGALTIGAMSAPLTEVTRGAPAHAHAHVPALDGVRGLAILMVTVYRFSRGSDGAPGGPGLLLRAFHFGEQGVDLFFVLSGFLITGILLSSKPAPRYFRNFYLRRLLRIFPLYYGVLVAAFVIAPMLSATSLVMRASPHQGWLWLYGANLLIASRHAWMLDGFNHFWSLAVEEHFYLVWPLVIFCCSTRAAMRVCLGAMLLALGLRCLLVLRGDAVAAEALTPCRMDALAAGAWVALAAREWGLRRLAKGATIAAATSLTALVAVHGWDASVYSIRYTLYASLFAAVIVLAVGVSPTAMGGRLVSHRLLRFFGKYSYGLYVFQGIVAVLAAPFLDRLVRLCGSPLVGTLAFLLVGSATSLGLALVSWHLYERRFLALKRHFS